MDTFIAWSQDKASGMLKAVGCEWNSSLQEDRCSLAVTARGVPGCVTCVTNRAEEVAFARWQWLVRLQGGDYSPHHLSKVNSSGGKQSWQEGRKGTEVMETSQGRVIKQLEQSLVHPSTSKLSNEGPVLSHDSTFKNISNICFSLCSLTCHHAAPTNTSSSLFKHSLMRKYCYNELQLKPGVKIKMSTGIADEWECVQKIARRSKTGTIAIAPRSLMGRRGFQILKN